MAAAARPGPGGDLGVSVPSEPGVLLPVPQRDCGLCLSPLRLLSRRTLKPLLEAALVWDAPEVPRGGRPVALLAVGGAGGGTPQQVASTPAPSVGNSPGRDFLKPHGVQRGVEWLGALSA